MSLFLRPLFVLPGGHVDSKNGTSFVHGFRFIQGNVEAYLIEDGIHGQLKQNEKKMDIHEKCISFQKRIVISKNSCLYFQFLNWLNIYLQGFLWSREVSGFLVTILKTSTGNNVIYKCCKEHVSKCSYSKQLLLETRSTYSSIFFATVNNFTAGVLNAGALFGNVS